jgi:phage/plasmid-like protein (TIGR03299 family)
MAAQWDTGFMVREPSWHRLERAVLKESPDNWEDARQESGLVWEVGTEPVYDYDWDSKTPMRIPGWQKIVRDDLDDMAKRVLAIQPTSYAVINNAEFGDVINTVIGHTQEEDPVTFEALFSLYGGKQIVALLYFDEPLKLGDIDCSKTYRFLCFVSRHDGNGGLRGIPTNVRVQCANTLNSAEMLDGRTVGFTIRHTTNWDERVAIIALQMQAARGETEKWVEFAQQLASWKFNGRQRDTYLKRMFPVADDMGTRMADNRLADREQVRTILTSPSVADLEDTGYKLLMATTEWSDHYRGHANASSYIGRQLLRKEEPKARAARILRNMAGVK